MRFLTEDEDLIHWSLKDKLSVRSLTLLTFAIGWTACGQPQLRHESMMPVLAFSLLSV